MADRPILFSGPMVRALLAGTKTQTRRTMNPQPELQKNGFYHVHNKHGGLVNVAEEDVGREAVEYLRIAVGDRLYVREHWSTFEIFDELPPRSMEQGLPIWFAADDTTLVGGLGRFRQGMHMPRWASRLTLTVTDVRVERLQDITETDALAEGMTQATADSIMEPEELAIYAGTHILCPDARGRILYETIWDQINGDSAWASNPWVAAYTFTVEHGNIDQVDP